MANSAGDARGSELEIRKKLIQTGGVDVIVSVGSNFFYTVTLPCTLWFFDKAKAKGWRKGEVLFIDARSFYRQVSRANRDFLPEQIEFLANIARLWRCETVESVAGSQEMMQKQFPEGRYRDIAGVCKAATLAQIEAQGWSLNPGRYVGVTQNEQVSDEDFKVQLEAMAEELEVLTVEANSIYEKLSADISMILASGQ